MSGWLCTTPWVLDEDDEDEDEPYDDEADGLTKCTDCGGSGWYVGLVERRYCPTCDGSGYVEKGGLGIGE